MNNNVTLETIKENREILVNGRVNYFTELVKIAVSLTNEMENEVNEEIKELKSMLVLETVTMMTTSWRNTLPFNLFVSKKAAEFVGKLGMKDLRNHDYSLKIGMEDIIANIEEPWFLSVAENLNDQDVAKLNKSLKKGDKALNSNVMLHWEHAYTGKMFSNHVMELISHLSNSQASEDTISEKVQELVNKQAIVWILKTENYVLTEKGYKDTRDIDWETAYKECGIDLCDVSKEDYQNSFGKEW